MKCQNCGFKLHPDFNFCPGCGSNVRKDAEFRQIIDDSFSKLEEVVQGDALLRLESLSTRLESIEEELESFLSTAPGLK